MAIRLIVAAADRVTRADVPTGWPLGVDSRERFWQTTMPWPRGVQEDTELAWHVPVPKHPAPRDSERQAAGQPVRPVPPTRPQARLVGR